MVRSPAPFELGQNGCWPSRGSQLPWALPYIFSLCCPLNDRRRAAHSIYKIGRLFSLFPLSCPTLALLHLLILLLLLMSGNVHPNPGPIFPCSVCAGNVTWRGKSVQCCTCSKWVHLRCSQLSCNFRALGSSHSWSCPPCRNTVTPPSSDSSDTYTSTVESGPPLLMLHSRPTLISKLSIPHLPILYLLPLPSNHRPLLLAVLLHLLPPLLPLTLSGFFNGMLEVSESGALNYFIFYHPIQLILSASRNPILTHLPLFGFLDFLLCVLVAPTPDLASSLLMPRTPAAASSFLSDRAYPFLNFLPPLSSLDPYSDYVGINISLNNSSSVSFHNVHAPPIRFSPTNGRTDSFSPSILSSSRNLFILGDFNCHHLLWDSRGTSDLRGEEVFDWVISSDLLPLNDPDTPTLLHRSSGSRSSPDIFFAPSTLAFSCSWEVLQDLGSDHLAILLSIPLSLVFHPNERPPSFDFQKPRWDGFASYFDTHCPSAEEYLSLSLSSAAALFTPLALNAAKSSIPFGRIKRPPKAWWSAEVEQAVSERRKAFAAAHRSDEDRQAYISASRRASSVIAKAKTEAWQTTCTSLSPRSKPKSVHSLLRSIAGSPSSSSSSPNFPNCSSPRESDSAYAAYLRSHFSVSQPKTLHSRARGYLTELCRATCSVESHSSFCSPFSPMEFLAAASNLLSSTATGQDKVAYPMLKHLPCSGMDFLLHIFNLSWSSHFFPSIWKTSSIIPIHKMGKPLDSPASF